MQKKLLMKFNTHFLLKNIDPPEAGIEGKSLNIIIITYS